MNLNQLVKLCEAYDSLGNSSRYIIQALAHGGDAKEYEFTNGYHEAVAFLKRRDVQATCNEAKAVANEMAA